MFDLRIFIGAFFVIIGAILAAMPNAQAALTDGAVNLYAGLAMLTFGAIMSWLGLRSKRGQRRHS